MKNFYLRITTGILATASIIASSQLSPMAVQAQQEMPRVNTTILRQFLFQESREYSGKLQEIVAINMPKNCFGLFTGNISNGKTLRLRIPESCIIPTINEILRVNEGRVKDTKFNRVSIRNMRGVLVDENFDPCGNQPNCVNISPPRRSGGIRINGEYKAEHRELIGCVFNKCHYTPWASVSGSFSLPIYFKINRSILDLEVGGLTVRGSRWYSDLVAPIASAFFSQSKIENGIRDELSSFNGLNVRQLFIEEGSTFLRDQFGIDRSVFEQFINNNLDSINAQVLPGYLEFSINIPQFDISTDPPPPSLCPSTFSPTPFQGRTGRIAFYNEWSSPVTIILYHPNSYSVYNRYTVPGGQNQFLGNNIIVGDDWGVCFENKPGVSGFVNNLGAISDYNPNYSGSPLFMIQNGRIK